MAEPAVHHESSGTPDASTDCREHQVEREQQECLLVAELDGNPEGATASSATGTIAG